MLRWMIDKTKKDRVRNETIWDNFGAAPSEDIKREKIASDD